MQRSEVSSVQRLTELSEDSGNAFTRYAIQHHTNDTFGSWDQIHRLPVVSQRKPKVLSPRSPVPPKTASKALNIVGREHRPSIPAVQFRGLQASKPSSLEPTGTAMSRTRKRLRAHLMALSPFHEGTEASPRGSETPRSIRQGFGQLRRKQVESRLNLLPMTLERVVSLPELPSEFRPETALRPGKIALRIYS